jgi:hypothetical protein
MKTFALGLVMLGTFAVACEPVTVQNGPYYALLSWDQQIPSAQRFIVLSDWGNAAVLDKETGLVWEKEPDSYRLSWYDAFGLAGCRYRATGNRRGWRPPSVEELSSLADPTQKFPALPAGNPFKGVDNQIFWTATTTEEVPTRGYTFNTIDGFASTSLKDQRQRVWCVRGGSSVSNPPY